MTDIVERLREGCGCNFPETTCMAESECADAFEAADEITRLRAENERLRAALREIIADSFSVYAIQVARAALDALIEEDGKLIFETPTASAAENTDDR